MTDPTTPPPPYVARVHADGTGVATIHGIDQPVRETTPDQARKRLIAMLAENAAARGTALPVLTVDPDGRQWQVLVHPDGTVTPRPTPPSPPVTHDPAPEPAKPHSPPAAPAPHRPAQPRGPVAAAPIGERPRPAAPPPPGVIEAWSPVIAENNAALHTTAPQNAPAVPAQGRHILVLSLKGGVGKTTTAIGIGVELSDQHTERVIALDGDHYGTLTKRFPTQVERSMSELAQARDEVDSFVALRRFLSSNPSRLHAINGGGDVNDYEAAADLAERYADTVITDCRTDLDNPTVKAALHRATHCVVVIEPADDAMTAGLNTLDHLAAIRPALAGTAVIAVCHRTRPTLFGKAPEPASAGHTTVTIPFDGHLHRGGVINHLHLRRRTRAAYARLAAAVSRPGATG